MTASERGDLVLGFLMTMEEVAARAEDLRAAATALGAPAAPGALPLDALQACGYAVHPFRAPLPGDPLGRCAYVGWSLLPAPVGAAGSPDAPVDRARLVEAEGHVKRLLDLLKLDKAVGYHLVLSSMNEPADPERV